MDYSALIEEEARPMGRVGEAYPEPGFFQDSRRAGELLQEHKRCVKLLETWRELRIRFSPNRETRFSRRVAMRKWLFSPTRNCRVSGAEPPNWRPSFNTRCCPGTTRRTAMRS